MEVPPVNRQFYFTSFFPSGYYCEKISVIVPLQVLDKLNILLSFSEDNSIHSFQRGKLSGYMIQ